MGIKIAFLMDTLHLLVTRYGCQMALKRIVQLCGEIALACKNAVGLRVALVVLLMLSAFLQLLLLLILPLLHLCVVKRVNFVKRILIAVKTSAKRKRTNAKNNLDPSIIFDRIASLENSYYINIY